MCELRLIGSCIFPWWFCSTVLLYGYMPVLLYQTWYSCPIICPRLVGPWILTTVRFRPAVFFLFCSVTTSTCIAKLFFPFWIHSFDKEKLHVLDKYNAILYNSNSPNNLVLSFFWFFAVSGCSVSKTKPSSQSNSEWSDEFDLWFSHCRILAYHLKFCCYWT